VNSPPAATLWNLRRLMPQQMHSYALAVTDAIFLNTRIPPFNRIAARRALDLAVDRSRIVEIAGGPDLARPTCQILPPDFPGYHPYCRSTRDPTRAGVWQGAAFSQAKMLVDASGTSGSAVTVSTVAQDPFKLAVGRYFVELLNALGYRAHLRTYPDDHSYYRQVGLGKTRSQVGFFGWQADYQAGSAFFEPLFTCRAFQPNKSFNMNPAGFCNPDIDRQIARATVLQNTNAAAADRAWQRIDREITDQVPWIALVNPVGIDLLSRKVGNYQRSPAFGALLDQLWVED
jgi:peptide/nickel transport system substrate-binding protein